MISIKQLLEVILVIQIVVSGRLSKDVWMCCFLAGVTVLYNVSDDKKVELRLQGASEYVIKIAAVDGTLSYVLTWPRNAGMLSLFVCLSVSHSQSVCLSVCQPACVPARPPARLPLFPSFFPSPTCSLSSSCHLQRQMLYDTNTHMCVSVKTFLNNILFKQLD